MSNMERRPDHLALEEASTADLVREALDEAKELIRIEIEIARAEVNREIARAKKAAVGFGIALAASVIVLCLLAVAAVLALGGSPYTAIGVAGALFVVGGIAALLGYSMLPRRPFEHTRKRLTTDVKQLREHIA